MLLAANDLCCCLCQASTHRPRPEMFCKNDRTEPSESSKDKEIELSADGRYPKETVKMGFVNYDTTAEQVLAVQEYFKYLQTGLNFEVIWSESLNNAEEEFAFIEQCAAAGCKGIIGYYNEGNEESAKLCGNLNMYYWGLGGKPEAMNWSE